MSSQVQIQSLTICTYKDSQWHIPEITILAVVKSDSTTITNTACDKVITNVDTANDKVIADAKTDTSLITNI